MARRERRGTAGIPRPRSPAGTPGSSSSERPESDWAKLILRLRCLRGARFTSSNGVEGVIFEDGVLCPAANKFVLYTTMRLDNLEDILRDNESHISHPFSIEVTLQEFLEKHPEYREKVARLRFSPVPAAAEAPSRPAEPPARLPGRPEPKIELLDLPEAPSEAPPRPEDDIPF